MLTAIAHCGFLPERVAHVKKMLERIPDAKVFTSYEREHAAVWFPRILRWIADQDEPVAVLNDDVEVVEDWDARMTQMCAQAPGRTLALHTTAAAAPSLRMCGERWLASYWDTGPGRVIWPEYARAMLEWMGKMPGWYPLSANEDTYLIHFAYIIGQPILHCLPAVVRHLTADDGIPSTLGYDHHPGRVTKNFDSAPDPWPEPDDPFYVDCPWLPEAFVAKQAYALKHYLQPAQTANVAICTPSKGGSFTKEYVDSLWSTAMRIRGGELRWLNLRFSDDSVDIIRIRNRFVMAFLQQTDCTELIWIDDDMRWNAEVLAGVVGACRSGKDIIGVPYPQKLVDWGRVAEGVLRGVHPETYSATYPVHLLKDPKQDGVCVEVASMGMGMLCMSRRALDVLVADALESGEQGLLQGRWYVDVPHGGRTANLFGFAVDPKTQWLLSDSHTICWRWKQAHSIAPWADGRVWMWCGEGAPVDHVGKHVYRGYPEGVLGLPGT